MGTYLARDIECDDAGEIQVQDGDLKLASTKRSHIQALHWLILTNRGEGFWGEAVADLGTFNGRLNIPRTHRAMEANILRAMENQRAFHRGDVRIRVVPIDFNEVLVTARMHGTYILQDNEGPEDEDETLGYRYPFDTGLPVKMDLPS